MDVRSFSPLTSCFFRYGLIAVVLELVTAQCYLPGGSLAANQFPCDSLASAQCCPTGWTCFSNKLCIVTDPQVVSSEIPVGTAIRGSCTNPSWNNTACAEFCLSDSDGGAVTQCPTGRWCCQSAVQGGACNCDTDTGTFSIDPGKAQTIIGVIGLEFTSTVPLSVPTSAARASASTLIGSSASLPQSFTSPASISSSRPVSSQPSSYVTISPTSSISGSSSSETISPSSSASTPSSTSITLSLTSSVSSTISSSATTSSSSSVSSPTSSSATTSSTSTHTSSFTSSSSTQTTSSVSQKSTTTTVSPSQSTTSTPIIAAAVPVTQTTAFKVGIGVAVAVLLLFLIAGAIFLLRRRNTYTNPNVNPGGPSDLDNEGLVSFRTPIDMEMPSRPPSFPGNDGYTWSGGATAIRKPSNGFYNGNVNQYEQIEDGGEGSTVPTSINRASARKYAGVSFGKRGRFSQPPMGEVRPISTIPEETVQYSVPYDSLR